MPDSDMSFCFQILEKKEFSLVEYLLQRITYTLVRFCLLENENFRPFFEGFNVLFRQISAEVPSDLSYFMSLSKRMRKVIFLSFSLFSYFEVHIYIMGDYIYIVFCLKVGTDDHFFLFSGH